MLPPLLCVTHMMFTGKLLNDSTRLSASALTSADAEDGSVAAIV